MLKALQVSALSLVVITTLGSCGKVKGELLQSSTDTAALPGTRNPQDLAPAAIIPAVCPEPECPKCPNFTLVKQLREAAQEQASRNRFERQQLYAVFLRQDPQLAALHKKLYSEAAADKVEVMSYLVYRYPIMVSGEKGRMMHHHEFVVRQPAKAASLKQKRVGKSDYEDLYKFNFTDYQNFELAGYDNVRYAWENPRLGIETAGADFAGSLMELSTREAGLALLIEHFKYNLDRSPENVSALYSRFKAAFFSVMSAELYQKLRLDATVDTLLEGHTYFAKGDSSGHYDALQTRFFGKRNPDAKMRSPREGVASTNTYWYYSFWERREAEGNVEVVLKALQEVQQHYKKSPPPRFKP